jgi:hypothetical protein
MDDDLVVGMRQDIERLVERLGPEDREFLCEASESELSRLHFRWGSWLRNEFRQNEFPFLFKFSSAKVPSEVLSFDEISTVAIREIWLHVRTSIAG